MIVLYEPPSHLVRILNKSVTDITLSVLILLPQRNGSRTSSKKYTIFTVRKRHCGKVMFYTSVSVILFTCTWTRCTSRKDTYVPDPPEDTYTPQKTHTPKKSPIPPCLSVILSMGCVSHHALGWGCVQPPLLWRHIHRQETYTSEKTPTPLVWWSLKRVVHILLECIFVGFVHSIVKRNTPWILTWLLGGELRSGSLHKKSRGPVPEHPC